MQYMQSIVLSRLFGMGTWMPGDDHHTKVALTSRLLRPVVNVSAEPDPDFSQVNADGREGERDGRGYPPKN